MAESNFEEMTIGEIVSLLGSGASEILDNALCEDSTKRVCCPGTTIQLRYAAKLTGKLGKLPQIIADLEKIQI